MNKLRIVCLCFIISFSLSCSENQTVDGKSILESSARLPGTLSPASSCFVKGYELSLKEWIQAGDGLVFGTIEKVEPALDIGFTNMRGYEKQVRNLDECDRIGSAFKVELKDVKGYFHDQDVPERMTVYFGFEHWNAWTVWPEVTSNDVIWPEGELRIEPGMRIGGLLIQDQLTKRWGFDLYMSAPMIQIIQDEIYVQKVKKNGNFCGPITPVSFIETLSESALLEEVSLLDVDSNLYVDRDERIWAQKEVSEYQMARAGNWLGSCRVPPIDEPGDECTDSTMCDDGFYCRYGFCDLEE